MISCIGYRKLGYLVFVMGLAYVVGGDCPLGYCTLPTSNSTTESCNIEVDSICSSEIYCHGNGQCFKDRGSSNVFCNCSEETDGDSCQFPYDNTLTCSSHLDCNFGYCNPDTKQCFCPPGYRGNNCEIVTRHLLADYHHQANMCEHGGTMYFQAGKGFCMCPCGFSGRYCIEIVMEPVDTFLDQDTQPSDTTVGKEQPKSQTQSPFTTSAPSAPKPCNNGFILSLDQHNRPTCHCDCGYFGQFCEYSSTPTAENYKDWCDDAFNYCLNGATCKILSGKCSPICKCQPGYFGYRCNETMATMATRSPSHTLTVEDKGDRKDTMKTVIITVSILLVVGLFGCIFFCICILDDNCKRYLPCYNKKSNDTERSFTNTRSGHTRQNRRNNNTSRSTRRTPNRQRENMALSPTSNLVIGNGRPLQSVIALPIGQNLTNAEENHEDQSVYTEANLDPDNTTVDMVHTPPPYGEVFNVKLPTYEEATINHI